MVKTRAVFKVLRAKQTMEGAGVKLKRAFGYNEAPLLDPFLLLDDFHSEDPDDYMAGFPWHPHRGIETVTYMLHGAVEHGDSMGNRGVIESGDVQWMTAGGGIIHQEMPRRTEGMMQGFQLWINLPASHKMMEPRYREVSRDTIPIAELDGIMVKVICGNFNGTKGPVKDIIVDAEYLDVFMPQGAIFQRSIPEGYKVFAYILEGAGRFNPGSEDNYGAEQLVIFDDGDNISISTDDRPLHFLLVSGKPIGEPIAWRGPIVMNTDEELRIAFEEYQNGTFVTQ